MSELTTVDIAYGIEYGIHSTEPDGRQHSFSSDDAAVAFSAAQFCKYAITEIMAPAYPLDNFTTLSRVDGYQQYWGDIWGGQPSI